ncbi:30S ribosomal protein S21 [Candidatus Uhrbacteria bacterium]|nr:30S ribosomal protein S21 [Candidatus Uhrbacteria bacterium]
MLKVTRKKNESFESLFRRFSRRMQLSGRTLQVRKIRFFNAEPNKTARRASALRRLELSVMREYLMRTGQWKEEPRPTQTTRT